jgi:lysophospholipase L1-like esterase
MVPTVRWALRTLRERAAKDHASVAVLLVPHLKGIGSYDADFAPVKAMLRQEGIPYADALEAFDDLEPEAYDVGDGLHPNPQGHKILEAAILERILDTPDVASVILGYNPPARP